MNIGISPAISWSMLMPKKVIRSGNRTCYTGHAAAYGVERDGQADDGDEDGRNAHYAWCG